MMNDSACYFFWFLSMLISATGALAWMKVVTRADPDWKAKNHRWHRYIIAGGGFSSPYEAADDFWFFILINGPAEEWWKFLVFWIPAKGRGRVKEPRDGVLVAMTVALGFSFWENIRYLLNYGPGSIPSRLLRARSCRVREASRNRTGGGFEMCPAALTPEELRTLKRNLPFDLKSGADEWIRRTDAHLERERLRAAESIWR